MSHAPRAAAAPGPDADTLRALIEREADQPGATLPVLHALQDALGHVPEAAVPLIAERLNLSRAEVHGVVTFYHHFRREQPGRHVVQICRAEACQAVGARALEAHAKQTLGCDFHHTTADGAVTLEAAYCLGLCACGPAIRVDDEMVARVDAARFDEVIAELRAEVQA